jgi:hypothetical protein
LPNQGLAGFHDNELCLSVPDQPHAWPVINRQTTHAPIVGIGAFGSSILVTTEGRPYLVNAADPAASSIEWLELTEPCVAKRGVVDMGYAILYPAPTGLMLVGQGRDRIITEDLFTEPEWAALNPASLIAARAGDRYVAFYEKTDGIQGGFILDPKEPRDKLTFLDFHATSAWADPADGTLYLVIDGQVKQWNADAAPMTYRWRSKRFVAPRLLNFAAAQIHADDFPVTLRLYCRSGNVMTLKYEHAVSSSLSFWLPSGYRSDQYEIEVEGQTQINAVYLAESVNELKLAA